MTALKQWLFKLVLLLALCLSLFSTVSADSPNAATVSGIGVLGDSNSDEYRADDNRGGTYAATTLNWMEQLVLSRGLNFGPWGRWGGPRRSGYKYNWARSGATVRSMISFGQHTGLARQVANGEVSHVFMWIGSNDFHILSRLTGHIGWALPL